jgi:hypothetical protein
MHGHRTASGEKYHKDSLVCAHASLAFYNSGFDKSLVVVIDRSGAKFDNLREGESVFIAEYPNKFTPIYKSYWLQNLGPDVDEENRVYQELILDKNIGDYIFIHEKKDENILIDRSRINSVLPIIYADKKYKTFSLLKVIENAKECHIISSSFLSLLMCYKLNNNVCAHMYSDRIELSEYIGKNNIKVIK